ncbi:hypothetical protein [Dorea longicatena]|uniref:hypothetical protein n=1 Tax=Dorea longicatena TaxID=88431 RepID=UPI00156EA841|nr:hypothetical protein [Dorea longicatena]NSD68153.1 hypothetical protein [Dorea longicatena]
MVIDDLVVNGWNYAYSVSMQEDNNLENWTALLDAAIFQHICSLHLRRNSHWELQ